MQAWLTDARARFHAACLAGPITVTGGVASIADRANGPSKAIAIDLVTMIGASRITAAKPAGQTSGNMFETVCQTFLAETLAQLQHIRPGVVRVERGSTIAQFDQYAHLAELQTLADKSR